jgi:hypothetical protein
MGDYALFKIETEPPEPHVTTGGLDVIKRLVF